MAQKWDYKTVQVVFSSDFETVATIDGEDIKYPGRLHHVLKTLGQDGWELVTHGIETLKDESYYLFVFKRPID